MTISLAERLDESLYSVQKSIADAITSENISDTIASSSWQNSCMPATCDLGSAYRQNNSVSKPRSSGGSVKTSASTPRTPHSTHTIHASNSNTALSGARFYVDPDLPDDLQAKVARLCSLPPIEHIIGLFKFMLVFLFFNYLFLLFLSSSPLYLISLFAMLSDPMELF